LWLFGSHHGPPSHGISRPGTRALRCFSKPASQPATSHRRTRSAFAFAARDEGSEGRARKKQRTKKTVCQAGDDPSNPLGGYPVPTERTPGMNPQSITRSVITLPAAGRAHVELLDPTPQKRARNRSACGRPRAGCICRSLGKETVHGVEGIWQSGFKFVAILFAGRLSIRAGCRCGAPPGAGGLPCLSLAGVVSVLCSAHSRLWKKLILAANRCQCPCTTSGQCEV
jgi:hypothetical protein